MLIVANHLLDVTELKIMLGKEFEMKYVGASKMILGTKTHRDMVKKSMCITP